MNKIVKMILEGKQKIAKQLVKKSHVNLIRNRKINKNGEGYTYSDIPKIIFTGKWLEDYNFHCGKPIEITATKDKIIIKISDQQPIAKDNSGKHPNIT